MPETPAELLADVALAVPGQGTFQYLVPSAMSADAKPGQRVFVQMRSRRMVGTIVSTSPERIVPDLKSIDALVGHEPMLGPELLSLTRWMSDYYACSWGQAIDATLPASFKKGRHRIKARQKKEDRTLGFNSPAHDYELTADQRKALEAMIDASSQGHRGFLLHGVTGSGKTEIYIHLIRHLLGRGRSSIVLVPEISLTPQTVERFRARFGDTVAVIHSRLSQGQKVAEWHRIRSGEAKVVVGARSAVFSPVQSLGLIILDEEHETSYKQEEAPRYHAREVALKRAEQEGALLLLGSATPSLESFYAARSGKMTLLSLPKRIEDRPLPLVEVVDMRRRPEGKREVIFSGALQQALHETLQKKEQAMLLLNRRGFSTHLHCASCGYVMTCPHCRISLAYHLDRGILLCHVCHYQAQAQRLCPGCQKNYLHYFGIGTQKVEQEARRLFPDARFGRMDADSTSKKDAHETILRAFQRRDIDILIGTQMIAKGHDFPNVSLIGVVSADTALHVPDFRSGERTFDLLTQVAGRAGRGDIPGRVLIQTFVPHHYAIQSAKEHHYLEFYDQEIRFREELSMPPYTHLIRILARGRDEKKVVKHCLELANHLRPQAAAQGFMLLGPAPCLSSKEHGQYHWNLYLKGPEIMPMNRLLSRFLKDFKRGDATTLLDVDPL